MGLVEGLALLDHAERLLRSGDRGGRGVDGLDRGLVIGPCGPCCGHLLVGEVGFGDIAVEVIVGLAGAVGVEPFGGGDVVALVLDVDPACA